MARIQKMISDRSAAESTKRLTRLNMVFIFKKKGKINIFKEANRKKVAEHNQKLISYRGSQDNMAELKSVLSEAVCQIPTWIFPESSIKESELRQFMSSYDPVKLDVQIKKLQDGVNEYESRAQILGEKLKVMNSQMEERTKINIKESEVFRRTELLNKL